jgi:hypothetical protein
MGEHGKIGEEASSPRHHRSAVASMARSAGTFAKQSRTSLCGRFEPPTAFRIIGSLTRLALEAMLIARGNGRELFDRLQIDP